MGNGHSLDWFRMGDALLSGHNMFKKCIHRKRDGGGVIRWATARFPEFMDRMGLWKQKSAHRMDFF